LMSQWATRGKLLLLLFYPFLLSIWACKSNLKTYYIASHCNPSETQIQIKFTQFSSLPLRALSWTTSKSRLVHNNRQVHKEVLGTKTPQAHYKL
jgi:hypothetical protein